MDKNIIKQYLDKTFLSEAKAPSNDSTPAIKLAGKLAKDNAKINKDGVKAIGKDVTDYESKLAKADPNAKTMATNKVNYATDKQKEYHDEMEIMNGQEMLQYGNEPNQEFKDKAIEGIEGSSRMGNNPEWANVVAKGQGGDPEFGKNLVKKIKSSIKKRSEQTPTTKMYGDDWEVVKDNSHKAYAVEGTTSKPILTENIDKTYTHFAVYKPTGKIVTGWEYNGVDRDEVAYYSKGDLKDWFPDNKLGDFKVATKNFLMKNNIDPFDAKNWGNPDQSEAGPEQAQAPVQPQSSPDTKNAYNDGEDYEKIGREVQYGVNPNENKNTPQIKENMKRLKFKKEFNGVGNALKLIPEGYKVDKKVFEMTDGNESYKIRWEGSLTEGSAVILTASDKKHINEDMQKMKHLMSYRSQDTLGTVKGKDRIDENKSFSDIWNKTKKLMGEAEDIEGQSAEEGEWDDVNVPQAKEAKKDVEGSTSTDKGTKAPKAKEGHWEDINVPQAPEAKKHIQGSVSTEKGTKAPAPKKGDWDDAKLGSAKAEVTEAATKTGNWDEIKKGTVKSTDKGTKAPKAKEGEWDEISVPQAPEAKKHIEGSASTDKGTKAPKAKEGEWDEISIPQAKEAKKHIHMHEAEEIEDDRVEESDALDAIKKKVTPTA